MELTRERLFSNKSLRRLIIPLVIEQALAITVGMVDTIMVSAIDGAPISAVSLVDMINVLIINIFAALATGGAVVVSQYMGAKKEQDARRSAVQLMVVAFLLGFAAMAVSELLTKEIIELFFGSLEEGILSAGITYYKITAISFPFIAVFNACSALFRATGDSKTPMLCGLLSNVINIGGNALLIFVFNMGVAGAAWATTFSRFAAMLIMLVLITNKNRIIYIDFKEKFRFHWATVKKILYIGIPSGMENSIFQLGRIMTVRSFTHYGQIQTDANAMANIFDATGCIIGHAMGIAMLTVIGQCVGACDEEQVRYYLKKLMRGTYIAHAIWNVLVIASLPLTLSWFGEVSNEARDLAFLLIVIHDGAGIILWPMSFTFPNALRAANDVKYTMVVSIASMIIFRIGLSYLLDLTFSMGAIGVWIAMLTDWAVRGTFFFARYKSGKWLDLKKAKARLEKQT